MLTGTRVTAALETLAERRVSGMLEIEGNPAGTIYLDQGQITFARAAGIPDLSARLPGALPPSAAPPDLIAEPDRPDRDIGSVLVQRKYLSRDALQGILYSIIVDAALMWLVPVDRDAFVSDVRFAAPGTHWAGAFSSLCVDFVLAEASKKAERVARYNLARTTPVQLCDLRGPAAVLTREQWAVACAIDGTRSVQDLAWRCGLALYEATECVGSLIQAGVCAPCAPADDTGPLARWFGRDEPGPAALPLLSPTEALTPTPVLAPMPVRSPRSARPAAPARSSAPARSPMPEPPPAPVLSPTAVLPPGQVSGLPRRAATAGSQRTTRPVTGTPVLSKPVLRQPVPSQPVPSQPVPSQPLGAPVWGGDAEPPGDFAPAQPDLLRRVLDGLRKLS